MIAEKLVLFSARSAKKTSEKLKIVEISEVQNAMHIKNVLVCHMISLLLLLSHYAEIQLFGKAVPASIWLSYASMMCDVTVRSHMEKKSWLLCFKSIVSEPTEAAEKNSCKLLCHLWATCTSDYHVCWPLIVFCLQSGVKLTQLSTRSLAIKTDLL